VYILCTAIQYYWIRLCVCGWLHIACMRVSHLVTSLTHCSAFACSDKRVCHVCAFVRTVCVCDYVCKSKCVHASERVDRVRVHGCVRVGVGVVCVYVSVCVSICSNISGCMHAAFSIIVHSNCETYSASCSKGASTQAHGASDVRRGISWLVATPTTIPKGDGVAEHGHPFEG
jgi:hypothetical protein